jgi:hypothetical protein
MRLAFNDLNYKNTNGYNSYAHGGSGTNNENWRADNQGVSHQWSVIMSARDERPHMLLVPPLPARPPARDVRAHRRAPRRAAARPDALVVPPRRRSPLP